MDWRWPHDKGWLGAAGFSFQPGAACQLAESSSHSGRTAELWSMNMYEYTRRHDIRKNTIIAVVTQSSRISQHKLGPDLKGSNRQIITIKENQNHRGIISITHMLKLFLVPLPLMKLCDDSINSHQTQPSNPSFLETFLNQTILMKLIFFPEHAPSLRRRTNKWGLHIPTTIAIIVIIIWMEIWSMPSLCSGAGESSKTLSVSSFPWKPSGSGGIWKDSLNFHQHILL